MSGSRMMLMMMMLGLAAVGRRGAVVIVFRASAVGVARVVMSR